MTHYRKPLRAFVAIAALAATTALAGCKEESAGGDATVADPAAAPAVEAPETVE